MESAHRLVKSGAAWDWFKTCWCCAPDVDHLDGDLSVDISSKTPIPVSVDIGAATWISEIPKLGAVGEDTHFKKQEDNQPSRRGSTAIGQKRSTGFPIDPRIGEH